MVIPQTKVSGEPESSKIFLPRVQVLHTTGGRSYSGCAGYKGSELSWNTIWRETGASSVCRRTLSGRYDCPYGLATVSRQIVFHLTALPLYCIWSGPVNRATGPGAVLGAPGIRPPASCTSHTKSMRQTRSKNLASCLHRPLARPLFLLHKRLKRSFSFL